MQKKNLVILLAVLLNSTFLFSNHFKIGKAQFEPDTQKVVNPHFTYYAITDSLDNKRYFLSMPIGYDFGASLDDLDHVEAKKCVLKFRVSSTQSIILIDSQISTRTSEYQKNVQLTSRATRSYSSTHNSSGNFQYSNAPLTSYSSYGTFNMKTVRFEFFGEITKSDVEILSANSIKKLECVIYFTKNRIMLDENLKKSMAMDLIKLGRMKTEDDLNKFLLFQHKADSIKKREPKFSDSSISTLKDYMRFKNGKEPRNPLPMEEPKTFAKTKAIEWKKYKKDIFRASKSILSL